MKKIYNLFIFILVLFMASSCSDILDETPRADYTPDYFKTEAGVEAGITSMYSHLRYMYGNGYYLTMCQMGTDETTWASNADGNQKNLDFSGVGVMNSESNISCPWGYTFPNINTCLGVIENGTEAGVDESLIAEARFFLAFDYFILVQTYGGVPLDLGAGELIFNNSTTRTSTRNTVPEVYSKAIFPYLLEAVENLPETQRTTGTVTKNVARLYLAKAYLAYGWWLENPNNVPTYPTCDRTDPDGHDADWYYAQAYAIAIEAINNPGDYGLQETFYEVNVGTNDRNSEIMLYADHTEESDYYNGGAASSYNSGSSPSNFAPWFEQWYYTKIRALTSSTETTTSEPIKRAQTQTLGRPWFLLAPTREVFYKTFNEKTYDSRFDGTFSTAYRVNYGTYTGEDVTYYNAYNKLPVSNGETILTFLPYDTTGVVYDASNTCNVYAGYLPTRADYVVEPCHISRALFPGNWKIGPCREDQSKIFSAQSASSPRPYNIAKFSELYLIAAEAIVKGSGISAVATTGTYTSDGTALGLVNVLRTRAGHWSYKNAEQTEYVADFSDKVVYPAGTEINVDTILQERSREFYGEGYRWEDLVRTQKLLEYGNRTFTIRAADSQTEFLNDNINTVTRTIVEGNYLRPIPQSQIDALEITDAEKTTYQNPEYQ